MRPLNSLFPVPILLYTLSDSYDVSKHPDVMGFVGTAEEKAAKETEILEGFLDQWDKSHDGEISFDEFLDYYRDVSAGIDRDEYFELMMRNAWHISGGEGAAENTTCLRVLVTHSDRSQTVEEVKDDLGLKSKTKEDMAIIRQRLEKQGVKNIAEISLSQ